MRNPPSKPIRVLLVEDSQLALTILKKMLLTSPDIEVVGEALNGKKALELIPALKPDIICTDLHMPVMDGLEFTREVMARYPTPILVISISVQEGSSNVFMILEAGAVDVFQKPIVGLASEFAKMAPELVQKVKIVAGVHVFRKTVRQSPVIPSPALIEPLPLELQAPPRIVVIGASTGGPQALQVILSALPADYPLPIVCIQHISEGFLAGLLDWLALQCRPKVALASSGEYPAAGTIYFPREGTHLLFDEGGRFLVSVRPPLAGHRPSVTLTMRSAAQCYRKATVGVLLTGMGRDGADGMLAISQANGLTIAQDEASSVIFGMPRQAIELGAVKHVLPLEEIATMLRRLSGS